MALCFQIDHLKISLLRVLDTDRAVGGGHVDEMTVFKETSPDELPVRWVEVCECSMKLKLPNRSLVTSVL